MGRLPVVHCTASQTLQSDWIPPPSFPVRVGFERATRLLPNPPKSCFPRDTSSKTMQCSNVETESSLANSLHRV